MRVLVLGKGAREHALGWAVRRSDASAALYFLPGNAGTSQLGENLSGNPEKPEDVLQAIEAKGIDLVVVGPEAPLAKGVRDAVEARFGDRVYVVGPDRRGAQLEASKVWAKRLMAEAGIPTAPFDVVNDDNLREISTILDRYRPPYVLKADGLAAGKGVLLVDQKEEAIRMAYKMVRDRMFGEASRQIVVEQYLAGREASVFLWVDEAAYFFLPVAKDYKRAADGDRGPNTGGMGAVSPGWLTRYHLARVKEVIVEPLMDALASRSITYRGFLYLGLMFVDDEPYVLEFNVRLGDPEAQVVLPRLEGSWFDVWLAREWSLQESSAVYVGVVLASRGYPGAYEVGYPIRGLDALPEDILIFHAGTRSQDGEVVTAGGRVLTVVAGGRTLADARQRAYQAVDQIHFDNKYFRTDIGVDLLGEAS